jgi:hypothetical protein
MTVARRGPVRWRGLLAGLALVGGAQVACAAGALAPGVALSGAFPAATDAEPVRMEVYNQGAWKDYKIRASQEGMEILIDGDSDVAIFYPWEGLASMQFNVALSEELSAALANADSDAKARALAPLVEPLFPFARLPETSTNVHPLIEAYLESLLASGQVGPAYTAIGTLPLKQLPPSVAAKLYALTEALFAAGEEDEALDLLARLRASRPAQEFVATSLRLAKQLADQRHFSASLGLYRTLLPVAPQSERKEIALRCAYLALEVGDGTAYEVFREEAQASPGEGEAWESIGAIVDGVRAYQQEDTRSALNALGRGLARIPADSSWREIAFYYNCLAYRQRGDAAIAASILEEMPLLFPDGTYVAHLLDTSAP